MADYGFKKPVQLRVYVPTMAPICSECHARLTLVQASGPKAILTGVHPALLVMVGACVYAGRVFEMEMDVRYLKEVQP